MEYGVYQYRFGIQLCGLEVDKNRGNDIFSFVSSCLMSICSQSVDDQEKAISKF